MRIVAISDLHGYLPARIPDGDLLVIAGDVCPDVPGTAVPGQRHLAAQHQVNWLHEDFAPWLDRQSIRDIVMCWGNHDYAGELPAGALPPLAATILTDAATVAAGLRIFGTPWTFAVPDVWAFDVEPDQLAGVMRAIPEGVDLLLTHSPPLYVLDRLVSGKHVGSPALVEAVARVRPRAHVFGHIHEARGQLGSAYNVAILDEEYRPYERPLTVIDL